MTVLLVALGSACGGVARYLVSLSLGSPSGFPVGTLAVNVLGSLAIGALSGWLARDLGHTAAIRAFAVVGFCGGFTTFSTFSNDLFRLLEGSQYGQLIVYATVSLLGGIGAVTLGYALSR